MQDLVKLRDDVRHLAKWYRTNATDGETVERSGLILEMLNQHYPDVLQERLEVTHHAISEDLEEYRRLWNNITLNDESLQRLEAQLQAGWALDTARAYIEGHFTQPETDDLLFDLFARDLERERAIDTAVVMQLKGSQKKMALWHLIAIFSGAMLAAVCLNVLLKIAVASNPVYGTASFCGLIASWYMRAEEYNAREAIASLQSKWNFRI